MQKQLEYEKYSELFKKLIKTSNDSGIYINEENIKALQEILRLNGSVFIAESIIVKS